MNSDDSDDSVILAFSRLVSNVMARDGLQLERTVTVGRQRLSKLPTAA